jgi:hypothetical protein
MWGGDPFPPKASAKRVVVGKGLPTYFYEILERGLSPCKKCSFSPREREFGRRSIMSNKAVTHELAGGVSKSWGRGLRSMTRGDTLHGE